MTLNLWMLYSGVPLVIEADDERSYVEFSAAYEAYRQSPSSLAGYTFHEPHRDTFVRFAAVSYFYADYRTAGYESALLLTIGYPPRESDE